MKKLISLAMVATLMFGLVACGSDEPVASTMPAASTAATTDPVATASGEVISFKLAENQPDDNPVTQSMFKFAELVETKTNGQVKIEVYANASLGSESNTIDQVQANVLDMARVNSVPLSEVCEELKVFTLPYIFANEEHKYKVLDGEIGDSVNASLAEQGFINLGYLEAGTRNFYSTKPIETVADLKGLKIRVQQSDVMIEMTKLLGAVPTPMDYGEVFTSLETGVIDGAENDFVSYQTSGHYEVAKNYLLDGHLSPPACLIVSEDAWGMLNDEQKKAVQEAADEAIAWQRTAMTEQQEASRKIAEDSGCVIREANVPEFQAAVAPLYDQYPQFTETVEEIRALQ